MVLLTEQQALNSAGLLQVPLDATEAEQAAALTAHRARLAALRNTAYPCRECAPLAFLRWANGHHDPGHDAASCPDCATPTYSRRRRRDAPALPERRDLQ